MVEYAGVAVSEVPDGELESRNVAWLLDERLSCLLVEHVVGPVEFFFGPANWLAAHFLYLIKSSKFKLIP